jgi:hypothetical protein
MDDTLVCCLVEERVPDGGLTVTVMTPGEFRSFRVLG